MNLEEEPVWTHKDSMELAREQLQIKNMERTREGTHKCKTGTARRPMTSPLPSKQSDPEEYYPEGAGDPVQQEKKVTFESCSECYQEGIEPGDGGDQEPGVVCAESPSGQISHDGQQVATDHGDYVEAGAMDSNDENKKHISNRPDLGYPPQAVKRRGYAAQTESAECCNSPRCIRRQEMDRQPPENSMTPSRIQVNYERSEQIPCDDPNCVRDKCDDRRSRENADTSCPAEAVRYEYVENYDNTNSSAHPYKEGFSAAVGNRDHAADVSCNDPNCTRRPRKQLPPQRNSIVSSPDQAGNYESRENACCGDPNCVRRTRNGEEFTENQILPTTGDHQYSPVPGNAAYPPEHNVECCSQDVPPNDVHPHLATKDQVAREDNVKAYDDQQPHPCQDANEYRRPVDTADYEHSRRQRKKAGPTRSKESAQNVRPSPSKLGTCKQSRSQTSQPGMKPLAATSYVCSHCRILKASSPARRASISSRLSYRGGICDCSTCKMAKPREGQDAQKPRTSKPRVHDDSQCTCRKHCPSLRPRESVASSVASVRNVPRSNVPKRRFSSVISAKELKSGSKTREELPAYRPPSSLNVHGKEELPRKQSSKAESNECKSLKPAKPSPAMNELLNEVDHSGGNRNVDESGEPDHSSCACKHEAPPSSQDNMEQKHPASNSLQAKGPDEPGDVAHLVCDRHTQQRCANALKTISGDGGRKCQVHGSLDGSCQRGSGSVRHPYEGNYPEQNATKQPSQQKVSESNKVAEKIRSELDKLKEQQLVPQKSGPRMIRSRRYEPNDLPVPIEEAPLITSTSVFETRPISTRKLAPDSRIPGIEYKYISEMRPTKRSESGE